MIRQSLLLPPVLAAGPWFQSPIWAPTRQDKGFVPCRENVHSPAEPAGDCRGGHSRSERALP